MTLQIFGLLRLIFVDLQTSVFFRYTHPDRTLRKFLGLHQLANGVLRGCLGGATLQAKRLCLVKNT